MKMTFKLDREKVLAIALLLFFGGMIIMATDLHPLVRLFPLVVCVPMLVLVCIQLLAEYFPKVKTVLDKISNKQESNQAPKKSRPVSIRLRHELLIFAWLVVLFIFFCVLGILPSVVLFLILFLKIASKQSWKVTVGITLGVLAFMYLLFGVILEMTLFSDWLV